jgi:hypothetical protein
MAAVRNLVYAQASFFGLLLVCVALTPKGFEANHGLSYYGEHADTIGPYALGFFVCCAFLVRAAGQIPDEGDAGRLATSLRILAALLLLDVATPDTISDLFYWLHVLASAALFVFELGLAGWLVWIGRRSFVSVALLATQFAAGLVAMFSQLHAVTLLSFGIVAFQVSFAVLLVLEASELLAPAQPGRVVEGLGVESPP